MDRSIRQKFKKEILELSHPVEQIDKTYKEIIPAIFSDHKGMELEMNNKRKVRRSPNM